MGPGNWFPRKQMPFLFRQQHTSSGCLGNPGTAFARSALMCGSPLDQDRGIVHPAGLHFPYRPPRNPVLQTSRDAHCWAVLPLDQITFLGISGWDVLKVTSCTGMNVQNNQTSSKKPHPRIWEAERPAGNACLHRQLNWIYFTLQVCPQELCSHPVLLNQKTFSLDIDVFLPHIWLLRRGRLQRRELLNLHMPQFPHIYSGNNNSPYFKGLWQE